MTYSDKVAILIDSAERHADACHYVPMDQRKDNSPARKKKAWQKTYQDRLNYLKAHMLGVKLAIDCGYKPTRKRKQTKRKYEDEGNFLTIEIPCYNAHDGCRNTVTVEVEHGTKVPRKVCTYCQEHGAPSKRGYGSMDEPAVVMGACAHSAAV